MTIGIPQYQNYHRFCRLFHDFSILVHLALALTPVGVRPDHVIKGANQQTLAAGDGKRVGVNGWHRRKRYANFGRRSTRPLFSYAFAHSAKSTKSTKSTMRFLSGVPEIPKVPWLAFWHFGTFGSDGPLEFGQWWTAPWRSAPSEDMENFRPWHTRDFLHRMRRHEYRTCWAYSPDGTWTSVVWVNEWDETEIRETITRMF